MRWDAQASFLEEYQGCKNVRLAVNGTLMRGLELNAKNRCGWHLWVKKCRLCLKYGEASTTINICREKINPML
jgi:hypothetical protein